MVPLTTTDGRPEDRRRILSSPAAVSENRSVSKTQLSTFYFLNRNFYHRLFGQAENGVA